MILTMKSRTMIFALLTLFFTAIFIFSQEAQTIRHPKTKESLRLYPETYDHFPELPSPYTTEGGTEIVVAFTKDKRFALIPVTLENGEPLNYRQGQRGKGRQLEVDASDSPTLARTGLHSEIELDDTRRITGRSVAEITDSGKPNSSSGESFMSQGEDINSVLKGDNRLARKLGLTHPQLAKPLFHIWNVIQIHGVESRYLGQPLESIDYFLYNGRKIRLIGWGSGHGWQESIFHDEILGMYRIEVCRELDQGEKAFLHEKYPHLSEEQMTEFLKMLSYIHTGEMVPYYIMRYGFYEGHAGYRADLIAIALIFGLRSIEEIEKAFEGNLYKELKDHFIKENILSGESK